MHHLWAQGGGVETVPRWSRLWAELDGSGEVNVGRCAAALDLLTVLVLTGQAGHRRAARRTREQD